MNKVSFRHTLCKVHQLIMVNILHTSRTVCKYAVCCSMLQSSSGKCRTHTLIFTLFGQKQFQLELNNQSEQELQM